MPEGILRGKKNNATHFASEQRIRDQEYSFRNKVHPIKILKNIDTFLMI